jgi:hypothetical protein
MATGSRSRGWVRFTESRALDLPKPRARAVALAHGWTVVAGARLAERVRAEGVRAGVLELTAEGKAWRDAVLPALPAMAARLAALHPSLGVRKVRVRLEGEAEVPPALAVPGQPPEGPPAVPRRSNVSRAPAPAGEVRDASALLDLAARYLRRQGEKVRQDRQD